MAMKTKTAALLGTSMLSLITSMAPLAAVADGLQPAPWNDKIQYEVIKASDNPLLPKVGENVAIRFRGTFKGVEFDNTLTAEQPYLYRAGIGLLLKGIDESVVNMHVGDKYHLVFGGDLAFGQKGRSSAPGKPRIPPMAVVEYDLELVGIPGTEEEFIADVEEE